MAIQKAKNTKFNIESRAGRTVVGLVALVATYIVAIRAIDTGSLWQYGLTFALLIFGLNRIISAVRGR